MAMMQTRTPGKQSEGVWPVDDLPRLQQLLESSPALYISDAAEPPLLRMSWNASYKLHSSCLCQPTINYRAENFQFLGLPGLLGTDSRQDLTPNSLTSRSSHHGTPHDTHGRGCPSIHAHS